MNVIVKTQAELDALPASFEEFTAVEIRGGTIYSRIIVKTTRGNSSVEAWENSSVEAWGNSSVEARENSSVVAWENSSVVAWGNSSVVARGNSSVEARGNSSVVAWGNSSVVAWENSSVVAWENSSVEAWGNVAVHAFSQYSTIEAWGFVVVWLLAKATVVLKSKTAQTITPVVEKGVPGWLDREGIAVVAGIVILFKRVSADFKTQEKTDNETLWAIGSTLEHPAWNPEKEECGTGKYHACSRPYFCDEFRSAKGDHYIAIGVAMADLFAWDGAQYPHKIAFRKGFVLHECTKHGKKMEGAK